MLILTTAELGPEQTAAIEAVDPRVRVVALTRAERLIVRGYPAPEGTDVAAATASLLAKLRDTEILLGWPDLTEEMLAHAPRLAWAHFTGAGVDSFLGNAVFRNPGIAVTVSRIAGAAAIGDYVLSMVLCLSIGQPRYLRQQIEHRWQRHRRAELAGRTLGIVGLGAIGEEVARRARPFGVRLLAIRRSADDREAHPLVDELLPPSALGELLEQSDFVALTLPLTPETRGLIGEAELRRMKTSACLINISRGPIIEKAALIRALKEGWIAGAALDVFDEEPLPAGSPLWDLENVVLTPHIAGASERHTALAVAAFCDNLRRYLAGRPLVDQVDRGRGY